VLLEACCERGYLLSEWEVKSFLPGLVEKCGQPQPNVRADCRCGLAATDLFEVGPSKAQLCPFSQLLRVDHLLLVQPDETAGAEIPADCCLSS
jgi:hypothetical protein